MYTWLSAVVKICAWCSFREFDKSTKEVHRRFLCRGTELRSIVSE